MLARLLGHATAFAPGRVNLIGEHTDYNGGLALPFAITKGVTVKAEAAAGSTIEASANDLGEEDSFDLNDIAPADGWRSFVRGVAAELQNAGIPVRAATLEISGDVPQGGGLSSSAALEVALSLALIAIGGADVPDPVALAKLCSHVENEWVGAQTGLLDQLASLCGARDTALRIDFRSEEITKVPLELQGHHLVTVDSGESHEHSASGYNTRRDECRRACELMGIESLRDASAEMIAGLPPPLDARVRHVHGENLRVEEAVAALAAGDLPELGKLMNASHASLRDLYEVSTEAVEHTVSDLVEAGAIGARIVGGGFGGNVVGLFPPGVELPADALEVRPGPGAHLVHQ